MTKVAGAGAKEPHKNLNHLHNQQPTKLESVYDVSYSYPTVSMRPEMRGERGDKPRALAAEEILRHETRAALVVIHHETSKICIQKSAIHSSITRTGKLASGENGIRVQIIDKMRFFSR
jgi:hypothetical protein